MYFVYFMFDLFNLQPITNSYYLFSFPGDAKRGRNFMKAATAMNVIGPLSTLITLVIILLMYVGIFAGPFFFSYSYSAE